MESSASSMIPSCIQLQSTARFSVLRIISLHEVASIVLATPDAPTKADLTLKFTQLYFSGVIQIDPNTNSTIKIAQRKGHVAHIETNAPVLKFGKRAVEPTLHGICHAEGCAIDLFW